MPAVIVTIIAGESGTARLLIFSQVVLSMQLSFAVVPLVMFTSDKKMMGEFVNRLAEGALLVYRRPDCSPEPVAADTVLH